jgi:hypothetical protein
VDREAICNQGRFLEPAELISVAPRKQPISFASHRARIFCKGCNRHFKHLEDAVIPLIEPMGKGERVTLGPSDQATLALWATKTAMAVIAGTAPELDDLVPIAHRRIVREEGLPPEQAWVGFFPWGGGIHLFAGDTDATDTGQDPPPV